MSKEDEYSILDDREAKVVVKAAYSLLQYTAGKADLVDKLKSMNLPVTVFDFPGSGEQIQATVVLFGVKVDKNEIRYNLSEDGFLRLSFQNKRENEPGGEYTLSVKRTDYHLDHLTIGSDSRYANGLVPAGISFYYRPPKGNILSQGGAYTQNAVMADDGQRSGKYIYPTNIYLVGFSAGLEDKLPGQCSDYAFVREFVTM